MPGPGLRAGPKEHHCLTEEPRISTVAPSHPQPLYRQGSKLQGQSTYMLSLTCPTPVSLQFSLLLSTALFSQGMAQVGRGMGVEQETGPQTQTCA